MLWFTALRQAADHGQQGGTRGDMLRAEAGLEIRPDRNRSPVIETSIVRGKYNGTSFEAVLFDPNTTIHEWLCVRICIEEFRSNIAQSPALLHAAHSGGWYVNGFKLEQAILMNVPLKNTTRLLYIS